MTSSATGAGKSLLRAAVDAEPITVNPVAGVRAPKVDRPKLVTPSPAQMAELIAAARGTTWEMLILLAATTGMRRSEVLGVTRSAVDLDASRLTVEAGLQRSRRSDGTTVLDRLDPKTDRSRRTFAVPPMAIERPRRWRTEQLARRVSLGPAWSDHDLVCGRGDGNPLDPDAFSAGFKRLATGVGLEGVRLHDLRHGLATALLKGGIHPAGVSAVLGHSKVAFTLVVYSHVDVGMTATAATEMDRTLGGAT